VTSTVWEIILEWASINQSCDRNSRAKFFVCFSGNFVSYITGVTKVLAVFAEKCIFGKSWVDLSLFKPT